MSAFTVSTVLGAAGVTSCLAPADQCGDPGRDEQDRADDKRGRPHRQHQRQGGHRRGDEGRSTEGRQQTRDAEQPGTDPGVLGGLLELLFRQPQFIADQPRHLRRQLTHQIAERRLCGLLGFDTHRIPAPVLRDLPLQ